MALIILIVALVRRSRVKKANRAAADGLRRARGRPPGALRPARLRHGPPPPGQPAYGQPAPPPPYAPARAPASADPAAAGAPPAAAPPADAASGADRRRRLRAPPSAPTPPPTRPDAASGPELAAPATASGPAEPGLSAGGRTVACGAMADLAATIEEIWNARDSLAADDADANAAIGEAIALLDRGEARVAELGADGEPVVHQWLKQAILLYFRQSQMSDHRARARSSTPTRSR